MDNHYSTVGAIAFDLICEQVPQLQFQNEGVAILRAAHPDVGDVRNDTDEVTVSIGTITHGHFNTFGEDLSPEQSAVTVADQVVSFLRLLTADRVVLWTNGAAGGWRTFEEDESIARHPEGNNYLWTGPWR